MIYHLHTNIYTPYANFKKILTVYFLKNCLGDPDMI